MVLTAISLGLILTVQQKGQQPPIQLPPQTPTPTTADKAGQPIPDPGEQPEAVLNITKHIKAHYNPAMVPVNGSWAGAMDQDIREGDLSFSVQNSTWQGKPCKYFRGVSDFEYHPRVKNKKVVFTPRLYVFAHISPQGRLLHMTTAYNGFGAPVQIEAIFHDDSIEMTKTEGVNTTKTTLYPTFSMTLFDHLFDPLIRDGLVVSKERQLAFIHPITGAPCVINLTLNGRFDGEHEYRKYEGYKIDVTSPDTATKTQSFITRHGELLQVNLPENQDAVAYTNVSPDEERNWGKFQGSDWDKPASLTQPNRTRFHTMAVPVLLTNPTYLILPIPYAMAL